MLIQSSEPTLQTSASAGAESAPSPPVDVEAAASGGDIVRSVAALTRSVRDLQGVLALAASKLPPDDPMASRIDEVSANLDRLARAVLDHAALRHP